MPVTDTCWTFVMQIWVEKENTSYGHYFKETTLIELEWEA